MKEAAWNKTGQNKNTKKASCFPPFLFSPKDILHVSITFLLLYIPFSFLAFFFFSSFLGTHDYRVDEYTRYEMGNGKGTQKGEQGR